MSDPGADTRRAVESWPDMVEWADDVIAHGGLSAGERWKPIQAEHAFAMVVVRTAELAAMLGRLGVRMPDG